VLYDDIQLLGKNMLLGLGVYMGPSGVGTGLHCRKRMNAYIKRNVIFISVANIILNFLMNSKIMPFSLILGVAHTPMLI